MIVLGIETSCDETAAAVVTDDGKILSNVILSQIESHQPYGGIVPEVAARAHMQTTDRVVAQAINEAGVGFSDLSAVAATGGPGLIGGVIVGVMTAKAIAMGQNIPFIAVNHLEGHALSARLGDSDVTFPYLLLLVSGGHCQLLAVKGVGNYQRLGTTIDDALGEAFDKTAKVLGLGYPGGPAIENWAKNGDAHRFSLPRPMKGRAGCDFSFSGLKAAVKRTVDALPPGQLPQKDICDMAASFQAAASECIVDRTKNAIDLFKANYPDAQHLVIAGGVAANSAIRADLEKLAGANQMKLVAPPPILCTDNGAMIAWAGVEKLKLSETAGLDFAPRPRWPLDPNAPRAVGAGVKA
ncbi:MAG: tRNA (adenosine(37)-N6)-threonylcarbamoyltransferase complex transferase subunit TsaD [Rhodospirillaceae bacterium]|nr:tRNA (adenosine(37)-N6)-threonylcarbamoyltransferase complex transferase subunit TsaD [Rhodospirillaceae bacterium]